MLADAGDDLLKARLARAVSGRIVRSLRRFSNNPQEALSEASTIRGCLIRGAALAAVTPCLLGGYLASIRRDDRERFEDTMHGTGARWIGETTVSRGFVMTELKSGTSCV